MENEGENTKSLRGGAVVDIKREVEDGAEEAEEDHDRRVAQESGWSTQPLWMKTVAPNLNRRKISSQT